MTTIPAGSRILAEDLDDTTDPVAAMLTAWATWTPTYTNLTVGSGGVTVARYKEVGKTVHYRWSFTLGTGSAIGAGPRFTLPVAPASGYANHILGDGYVWDSGVAAHRFAVRQQSGSTVECVYFTGGGAATFVSSTVPVTFGTGDSLNVVGTYERS